MTSQRTLYSLSPAPFLAAAMPRSCPASGKFIVLCMCFALAAILMILPSGALVGSHPERVVWLTALLTIGLSLYLVRQYRHQGVNPWTSAIALTITYYAFRYGWGALVVYYWEHLSWEAVPYLRLRFYHQGGRLAVENVCDLIMLGGLGLMIGALLPVKRIVLSLPVTKWRIDERRFRRNVILFLPVAAFIFLFMVPRVPPSVRFAVELSGRFVYLLNVICGFWLFSARSAGERVKWLIVVLAASVAAACQGLMEGLVGPVLAPIEFLIFGYMLARAKMPLKFIGMTIPLAFLLLFPFVTVYKEAAQHHKESPVVERLHYAWEEFNSVEYRKGVELAVDRFVARLAESSYPPIFARYFPEVYPYEKGRTLWFEAATLLPRFVWPDKPSLTNELDRYSAAVGLIREGGNTSAVFDAVSEYYLNFGPPGVFFLSIIHGLYLSVVTAWLTHNLAAPLAGAMSAAVFFTNPELFGVGLAINAQIKLLPVWLLFLYLLSRRSSRHSG